MRCPLLLLGFVLAAGAGAAQAAAPAADFVRVEKAARRLTIYAQGQAIRTFTGIQLGDAPTGPKRFEGDERTPEGRYVIDRPPLSGPR